MAEYIPLCAEVRELTPQAVVQWLARATLAWDGPRLREAIQKADRRRRSRPDESGMLAAFDGKIQLRRARATEDARESALQSLECVALLTATAVGSDAEALRELLVIKLVHNALEAAGVSGFAEKHVVFTCKRDLNVARTQPETTHVCRIVELTNGFVITPHMPWYPTAPVPLIDAVALWYPTMFGPEDPIGMYI